MKICRIDDDPISQLMRFLTAIALMLFRPAGRPCRAFGPCSGEQAYAILLDCSLPGHTGLEALPESASPSVLHPRYPLSRDAKANRF